MTVKQLAEELKVSKTTIKNIMRKNNIIPQKKLVNGQYIIDLSGEETEAIRKYFNFKHPQNEAETITANTTNEPKTPKNLSANTENITAKHTENTEKTEITESLIKLLQQDLEAKNKQIEDLNNRLAEAMKALDQEQQLKAIAEKKILELEAKPAEKEDHKEADQDQNIKKGFFKRLFKL